MEFQKQKSPTEKNPPAVCYANCLHKKRISDLKFLKPLLFLLPLVDKVAAYHFMTTIFLVTIPPTDDVSL